MTQPDPPSLIARLRDHAKWHSGYGCLLSEKLCREAASQIEADAERISTLEDAAFHFLTCRTCADDGEQSCVSGKRFFAFMRGEPIHDPD